MAEYGSAEDASHQFGVSKDDVLAAVRLGLIEGYHPNVVLPPNHDLRGRGLKVVVDLGEVGEKLGLSKARPKKAVKRPSRPSQKAVLAALRKVLINFFGTAAGNANSAEAFERWRKDAGLVRQPPLTADTEKDWFKAIVKEIRDGVKTITKEDLKF